MSSLGGTETPQTRDNLIAGSFPRKEVGVTLVSGQNLTRGTVLGRITASGKYTAYNNGAVDGSEQARGILAVDTDASGGDVSTVIYVTGEFNEEALTGFDEAARADLEALNCYVMA